MRTITALLRLLGDASGAMKALNQVQGGLGSVAKAGQALTKVGGFLTASVTLPLAGMAAMAAKTAITFDKAMMGVNSVLKLSGDAFASLKEDVLEFSTTTSQSSSDVAAALRGIVSSGFEAEDAMKVLRVSVDAAGNMMTDTATTTRAMTSVLRAFGMEAEQIKKIKY